MLEGHVTLTLGGVPATLAPTLGAALGLCRNHGSFGALLAKLEAYDLPAAVDVVRLGLGRTESERPKIEEEVFSAGLVDLTPDLIRFVILLANGGRPLTSEGEPDGAAPFVG